MDNQENNKWEITNNLKLENDIKNIMDTAGQMIKYYKYLGEMSKAYYDGLVESGFTNEEALKIVSAKSLRDISLWGDA